MSAKKNIIPQVGTSATTGESHSAGCSTDSGGSNLLISQMEVSEVATVDLTTENLSKKELAKLENIFFSRRPSISRSPPSSRRGSDASISSTRSAAAEDKPEATGKTTPLAKRKTWHTRKRNFKNHRS